MFELLSSISRDNFEIIFIRYFLFFEITRSIQAQEPEKIQEQEKSLG